MPSGSPDSGARDAAVESSGHLQTVRRAESGSFEGMGHLFYALIHAQSSENISWSEKATAIELVDRGGERERAREHRAGVTVGDNAAIAEQSDAGGDFRHQFDVVRRQQDGYAGIAQPVKRRNQGALAGSIHATCRF